MMDGLAEERTMYTMETAMTARQTTIMVFAKMIRAEKGIIRRSRGKGKRQAYTIKSFASPAPHVSVK
jgi:hypothetical protein